MHKFHVLGMNDDLWDRVRGFGSETWKGFEGVKHMKDIPGSPSFNGIQKSSDKYCRHT